MTADSFFKAWGKQEAQRLGSYTRTDAYVERPAGGSWRTNGYKIVVAGGSSVLFLLPFDSRVKEGDILTTGFEKWEVMESISLMGGFQCIVQRVRDTDPTNHEQQGRDVTKARPDPRRVFVIHGRNENLRSGMFTFLRSIGLFPLEWTEAVTLTGKAAPYIGEILDAAFSHAQAVVVLLTPDDEARLRESLRKDDAPPYETKLMPQARPNVLFEAGMALAHQPDRTVLVEFGKLRPFSDIGGRHVIRMENSTKARQALALRLRGAGCPVNLDGTDWQSDGDLNPPDNSPSSTKDTDAELVSSTSAGADRDREFLLDVISELEDDFRTAQIFQVEHTYRRPSIQHWKAFRNKIQLPGQIRAELTGVYARIDQWADIVDSGIDPRLGSMTIPQIAKEMRSTLPPLIQKLKELIP